MQCFRSRSTVPSTKNFQVKHAEGEIHKLNYRDHFGIKFGDILHTDLTETVFGFRPRIKSPAPTPPFRAVSPLHCEIEAFFKMVYTIVVREYPILSHSKQSMEPNAKIN